MGPNCPNAHINAPLGLIIEHHPDLAGDHAVMMKAAINPQYVHMKQAVDADGKIRFTAAYIDPVTRVVYYAERGTGSMKSKQGIYWYAEEGQATLAVKRVVLIASHAKEELSNRQAVQAKVFVPPPPPPPHPHQQGTYNGHLALLPPPPPPPGQAPPAPAYAAPGLQATSVNQVHQYQPLQAQPAYPTHPGIRHGLATGNIR